MQTEQRREKMLRILAMRGRTTASELAAELEVSERTIYRDLSVLSTSRPVSAICGRYGGIYITDPQALNHPVLRVNELALLRRIADNAERDAGSPVSPADLEQLREMIRYYSGCPSLPKQDGKSTEQNNPSPKPAAASHAEPSAPAPQTTAPTSPESPPEAHPEKQTIPPQAEA